MAHYFIGDIQGCYSGLRKALATIEFNFSKDTLWLTGDLVARGPDSLKTLKYLYKHQDNIKTVLGNHDLHLLSVANGIKKENPKDNLSALIGDKKFPIYIDWLRQQPLLHKLPKNKGYMSHAGLAPNWTEKDAIEWNKNVSDILVSKHYKSLLQKMYGNTPSKWRKNLNEQDKLRFAINSFTRMRFCTKDGHLDLNNKNAPKKGESEHLIPWFEYDAHRFEDHKWIFGHWASLMGETNNKNVIALDTGYVWGNYLSIFHLKSRDLTYVHNDV